MVDRQGLEPCCSATSGCVRSSSRAIAVWQPFSALIAMNRPEQLRFHLVRARDNGVTQEELIETITHLREALTRRPEISRVIPRRRRVISGKPVEIGWIVSGA
jgi:hypothetical protein